MVQVVRVEVLPRQHAFGAVNANAHIVFGASGRLADQAGAARAVLKAPQNRRVIVKHPARHHGPHVGRDPGHAAATHVAGQMVGMGANIAQHQRRPAALGVQFPTQFVSQKAALHRQRHTALQILGLHDADVAQHAGLDHGPRLPHHGVAAVIVGQAKRQLGLFHQFDQVPGLAQRVDHRFVADHVQTGLQRQHAVLVMAVIGRHHRDGLDAVLSGPG